MAVEPVKLVYWIATLAASIVVVTVFMNQYLTAKWGAELKRVKQQLSDYEKGYQHQADKLVALNRKYRLLLSERGER